MVELFSIGHFSVYLFGVTIAAGMLAGIFLISREAKRLGIHEETVYDITLYSLLGGVIGARIVYVLVYNPGHYIASPLDIIRINAGGLSIHGGILGGIIMGIWRVRKHQLDLWRLADLFAPALILGQAIGRIGCDVFGIPMANPYFWGVAVNGTLVHPAQIYELILNFTLFAWLWLKRNSANYKGEVFVHYLIWFSVIRSIVELFRSNPEVLGWLSVSHLLSIAGILAGLVLHIYLKKRFPLHGNKVQTAYIIKTIAVTTLMIFASTGLYYLLQG